MVTSRDYLPKVPNHKATEDLFVIQKKHFVRLHNAFIHELTFTIKILLGQPSESMLPNLYECFMDTANFMFLFQKEFVGTKI